MPLTELLVLVVEDEILIALGVQSVLEEANADHVEVVTSVSAAKTFVQARKPSLVVLDVRLTDGSSYDLARDLLDDKIPVVFHSAHTDQEDVERFPDAEFCPKPSTPDQMIEAISASFKKLGFPECTKAK